MGCRNFFVWVVVPILLASGYALHFHTTPAFDVAVLARVAAEARLRFPEPAGASAAAAGGRGPSEAATLNLERSVAFISSELARLYPRHIHPHNARWITNLAGGFKTSMLILHASMTEYVMIWGSQVATTGHSGRNLAEFHDFLLSGEGVWWKEGGLGLVVAGPSAKDHVSYIHTDYLQGGIVHLRPGTYMLEYCHGVIPALLPFGLGDTIFSSMDVVTLFNSLTTYGSLTIKELWENGKI